MFFFFEFSSGEIKRERRMRFMGKVRKEGGALYTRRISSVEEGRLIGTVRYSPFPFNYSFFFFFSFLSSKGKAIRINSIYAVLSVGYRFS